MKAEKLARNSFTLIELLQRYQKGLLDRAKRVQERRLAIDDKMDLHWLGVLGPGRLKSTRFWARSNSAGITLSRRNCHSESFLAGASLCQPLFDINGQVSRRNFI